MIEFFPAEFPGARRNVTEIFFDQVFKFTQMEISHRTDNDLIGSVSPFHEFEDGIPVKFLQHFRRTQNVPSNGMSVKHKFLKIVENEIGRGILKGIDLFNHHLFFAAQFLFRKHAVEKDIAQQFGRPFQISGQKSGKECGFFLGGIGIHFSSHVLDTAQHMEGPPFFCAFEDRMFYKMGDAMFLFLFIARTCIHDHSQMANR